MYSTSLIRLQVNLMSVQFLIRWIFVFITFAFFTSKSFAEKQHSTRVQPNISRQFYQLLTQINEDSSAVQLSELEAFVRNHPEFNRGAAWLFDKYVLAQDISRADSFFTNLEDSDRSLLTKNWMLGKVYSRQGKKSEALKAFTSALIAASPSPELILDFFIFYVGHFRKGEYPKYLQELSIDSEARSTMHALWYYINQQCTKAIDAFKNLSLKLKNDNLTILYSWGYCLNRSGDSQLARQKWKSGLERARFKKDLQFVEKFLLNLGVIAPNLQTQLSYFDSSYVIARRIGELTQMPDRAGNLGILYARQARFSLADSLFLEAIEFGRKMQSPWKMSVWYPRLGNLLVQQDRFDEALKAYDEGATFAKKAGNDRILIRCQVREGELYRMLGQYELALRVLTAAYKKARARSAPLLEVEAHIQLAHLSFATGRYAEARRIYAEYLKNPPTTRHDIDDHAWWRFRTGLCYLSENNYSAARFEFNKAYVLADSIEASFRVAASLVYLAQIDLIENDLESAHNSLDKCQKLAEQTEIERILPALYSSRGDAYKKAGEFEKAIPKYKKAANLVEQTRENLTSEASRLDYFGGKLDIYDKLVECCRDIYERTGNPAYQDSLYVYMEMKRGRTLRELQASNGAGTGDTDLEFSRDKLQQAGQRLKSQQRYLRDYGALFTKQEMDSVLVQVQTARLSLIAQRLRLTQGTSVHSDALLAELPSLEILTTILQANQSAAIFYHFSEYPFALAITGEATVVVSLPTTITRLDSSIRSLLNPFHSMTEDVAKAVFKADLAHELYRVLIVPIENAVQLPANVLIVPDAHLANLPFELLLTAKPERNKYTTADSATYSDDFLVQRYSIGYIPNASFMVETDFSPASQNVLVFADPFDEAPLMESQKLASLRTGWNFDPLIFSSKEADGIKDIHSKTSIFRREEATKERLFLETPNYDIIHFATHAFVDTTHDAFSGLVLSTSDDMEDDGILMGYEIADMKLNADLVALSACETGRGKVVPGEGVLGLPRLFLGAGAKTVLMTHWKVDDKFAADLMIKFYDYYLKQGLPKAIALTEAKRRVLNTPQKTTEVNYHHPLYWASFVMYGEPGFQKPGMSTGFFLTAVVALIIVLLTGFSYRRWSHKFYTTS